jgi:hypothetical protein
MRYLKEQRSEQIELPFEDAIHSNSSTVGEILDLIQEIQAEKSAANRKSRFRDVGIEFIKIAMGEIPMVGGALGVMDGLYAMYEAGKNDEHTWKDVEEYPILRRMKMHPELMKVLDSVVLQEIDLAYKEHLSGYNRQTRVTQITDIDEFAKEWIMGETEQTVEIDVLRECVRAIIIEATGINDFGGGNVTNRKNTLLDRPSKSRGGWPGGVDTIWTGEDASDHIFKWLTDMGFSE